MKARDNIGTYSIKETSGSFYSSVNRLLADGTDLFSSENEHILVTIDTIIKAEFPVLPDTVAQKGTSVPSLVSAYAVLVQWMKVRHIHYFNHLTQANIYQFIKDSAGGIEKVIQAPERIRQYLSEIKDEKTIDLLKFSDVLKDCGISPSLSHKLPTTRYTFTSFKEHKKLASPYDLSQESRVTTGTLWVRTKSLSHLWNHRSKIPDGLAFEPNMSEIAQLIKSHGLSSGSTKTIPIEVATSLVSQAFQWVYEYGPALRDIEIQIKKLHESKDRDRRLLHIILQQFNDIAESKGWTLRLCGKKTRHHSSNYQSYFLATRTLMPAASYVLCAVFTARRSAEILSINGGSLHGNSETGYWITTYSGKRAMDSPKPCTRSVAHTIKQMIEQMEIHGISVDKSVFNVVRSKGRLRSFMALALQQFANLIDYEDSNFAWSLASHQFRRIFALIFRWRYDHPDLLALSVYFEHIDFKQILRYTNDPEWQRINQEEALRFTAAKLQRIALDNIEPKGIFGRSLKKMVERELGRIQLTDEKGLASAMEQLAQHRGLELKSTKWGYCGARSAQSNLKRAGCTTQDQVRARATVDPESSTEDKCGGCLFFMTDESRAAHWTAKTESLQRSAASAPTNSMVETRLKQRLYVIERFSRNVFGESCS